MKTENVNTVIVGGGHAGCNFACWMEKHEPTKTYVILERAECLLPKWRHHRWEGFQINTPLRFSTLYGEEVGDDGETLDRPISDDLERWDAHIARMNLKYILNASVESVERGDDGGDFVTTVTIKTQADDGSTAVEETVRYVSKNVLAATGNYDRPKITLDEDLARSHPEIRQVVPFGMRLSDLQPGGILIVGGGQTGIQLADLFAEKFVDDRTIALCSSKIMGSPRSYRGRDIFYWMEQSGFLSMPKEALAGMPPEEAAGLRYGHNPITGACKPISLFSLNRKGVEILGSLDKFVDGSEESAGDCVAVIKPNRAENVQFTKVGYDKIMGMCVGTAEKVEKEQGLGFDHHVPEPEWVVETEDDRELMEKNGPLVYNLKEKGITNVIWATGLDPDFSWLRIPEVFGEFDKVTNRPSDLKCVAAPGLFFTGFPWCNNQQSTNIVNFDQDHRVIITCLRA